MKPDWKDAPEWANWVAMDKNGEWFWHERKPTMNDNEWLSTGEYYRCYSSGEPDFTVLWEKTLEERPE